MPSDEELSEPDQVLEPEREGEEEAGGDWPFLSDLDLGVCLATRPRLGFDGGPLRTEP